MMRWLTPVLLHAAAHANQQQTLREVGNAHRSRSPCVRADGSASASCFGFNPADSTAVLQQAFASGASRLSIDNVGQQQPWVVTPLILENVTNLVVVVDPGVIILAKEGAFHGGGDCLLLLRNCRNVTLTSRPGATAGERGTLRMRRDDYADPSKYLLCTTYMRYLYVELSLLHMHYMGAGTEKQNGGWPFDLTRPHMTSAS